MLFNAGVTTMMSVMGMLTPPSGVEYMAIIPGAIVAILSLVLILVDAFHRPGTRRDYLAHVSVVGLALALASTYVLWDNTLEAPTFHGMLYLDKFSLAFAALACISGALSLLQVPSYLRAHRMDRGEFYMLVLFSVVGVIFMASAADLLTVFLALEVMSIPVYCLAGFLRRDERSAEAAMKYFILGAFSAAIMLYGVALIYGITGTTNLEIIGLNIASLVRDPAAAAASGYMLALGVLLVVSGFAFKIAAAPFHSGMPDIYTGSPSPAVGFMSTAVKAGAFAAMIRVCFIAFDHELLRGGFFGVGWVDVTFFLAMASMVLGNVVAIMQTNVKRMLAYSSIAHAGYILVGLTAAGARPEFFLFNDAVIFYLVTYTFGSIGAFGVLSYLGRNGATVETYEDLAGLGLKYPLLGAAMGVFMFSSAGVPPTAGFVAKFYIFRATIEAGVATGDNAFITLAVVGLLSSTAGAYYYLRVLVAMFMSKPHPTKSFEASGDRSASMSLAICAVMSLGLGIMPGLALDLARQSVVDFQGAPAAVRAVQKQGADQLDAMHLKSAQSAEPAPAAGDAAPPQG